MHMRKDHNFFNIKPTIVAKEGAIFKTFRCLGSHFWSFPASKGKKFLDSLADTLGVEMSVLFDSLPFTGYSFLLTDGFCPIYPTCHQVPLLHRIFLLVASDLT